MREDSQEIESEGSAIRRRKNRAARTPHSTLTQTKHT